MTLIVCGIDTGVSPQGDGEIDQSVGTTEIEQRVCWLVSPFLSRRKKTQNDDEILPYLPV